MEQIHKIKILPLFFGVVLTFFISLPTLQSAAQTLGSKFVELTSETNAVFIGPSAYITQDTERSLTYETVVARHKNNLRGKKGERKLIHLGLTPDPSWIIVNVYNNSPFEEWFLDFGSPLQGRFSLADQLVVHNDTTGETFISRTKGKQKQASFGQNLTGSGLPINLKKDKPNLLVIFYDGDNNAPKTIAPRLVKKETYINSLRTGNWALKFFAVFFTGMIGFYFAAFFIKNQCNYLAFSLYYATIFFFSYYINASFFAASVFTGIFYTFLLATIALSALFLTKNFFNFSEAGTTENNIFIFVGALSVLFLLANIFLIHEMVFLKFALSYVPLLFCILTSILLSFAQGQRDKLEGHYFAAGWGFFLFGVCITVFASVGIVPPNALFMNAYLLGLIPQAFFFISGSSKKIVREDEEERHERARADRKELSLARLKQSKESADQTRLLRVLEREREMMSELREREILRTEEMRRSKESADEANRAKSAFLAVVSHEIRTPMTGILGMVRLLLETKLTKDQNEFASAIQTSGDTMMALLNDILDFEKIERGGLELEYITFDLPKLVEGVVTLMSGHASGKGLLLKSDISPNMPRFFIGDPTRLRQVLLNLVNNAIKFTDNGHVTIRVKYKKLETEKQSLHGDCEVYIGVEDSGIGISEEARAKLFSPFAQADSSTSRKYGGTGLGLAICKRIIEAMGSSVYIDSHPGEGSTFFFNLIMEEGTENTEGGKNAKKSTTLFATPPQDILIVEDNEMNRRVLKRFLENDNHIVTPVENGHQALEEIGRHKFDIILADINLSSEMSGIDLIKEIRSLPERVKAKTPAVALTGNVSKENIQEYYESGFQGFLAKPIEPEKLSKIIFDMHNKNFDRPDFDEKKEESMDESPDNLIEPAAAPAEEKPKNPQEKIMLKEDVFEDEKPGASLPLLADVKKPGPGSEFSDETENPDTLENIDLTMLKNLLNSLGKETFTELMKGYEDKADEIIEILKRNIEDNDFSAAGQRAHELKGMAANFGMKELSATSHVIEEALDKGQNDKAQAAAERLPEENRRAKETFRSWLKAQ